MPCVKWLVPVVERIILVRPENPENTGLIARLCSNYEADLKVVNPEFNISEARRAASHYQEKLNSAEMFSSLKEAVEDEDLIVASKMERGTAVRNVKVPKDAALMVGPEADGLTREDLEKSDVTVKIDTPGEKSLNQATATAVLLDRLKTSEAQNSAPAGLYNTLQEFTGSEELTKLVKSSNPSASQLEKILGDLKNSGLESR